MAIFRILAAALGVVWVLASVLTAEAQQVAPAAVPEDQLRDVEQEFERARGLEKLLEAEMLALQADQAGLNQQLVATAVRLQAREVEIRASENRLEQLAGEALAISEDLMARQDVLADLLAGLMSLDRDPPPALMVRPDDVVDAIRGALLLGSVVSDIGAEAAALKAKLDRLQNLRTSVADEQQELQNHIVLLEVERARITDLIATRVAATDTTYRALLGQREKQQKLALKANSLKDLIAELEAGFSRGESVMQQVALMPYSGPFSTLKGQLSLPVVGDVVQVFGDSDGAGGWVQGVVIATRPESRVIAPCAGRVVYAGKFRGYGQVLILDPGEGYHVVLAGLAELDGVVDSQVIAGQPVGLMGQKSASGAGIGVESARLDQRPMLYVEFRKDGVPFDPVSWWREYSKVEN